mmetsp:Transcript_75319/g.152311  ORF Transcript_75319/g.152311 Transcript_75319/m.152311 type:complete len:267 (+) Transcript_75319:945-1745(+)
MMSWLLNQLDLEGSIGSEAARDLGRVVVGEADLTHLTQRDARCLLSTRSTSLHNAGATVGAILLHGWPGELEDWGVQDGRLGGGTNVILLLVLCREFLNIRIALLVHRQAWQDAITNAIDDNGCKHIQLRLHCQWLRRRCQGSFGFLLFGGFHGRGHLNGMFLLFLRGFLHVRVVVHQSLSVQLDVRQGFHLLILRGGHVCLLRHHVIVLLVRIGFRKGQALLAVCGEATVSDQGIAIVIGRSQCRFHAGHGHSESGGAMLWDYGF